MLHRPAISDFDGERIKDLLPGRPGQPGWTARDYRLFLDAVLWIAKTGVPWRDLPERLVFSLLPLLVHTRGQFLLPGDHLCKLPGQVLISHGAMLDGPSHLDQQGQDRNDVPQL